MSLGKVYQFNVIGDERGSLVSLEQLVNIPFEIKRVYFLYDLDKELPRGFHAHRNLEQVAVCIKGSCTFLLDDGSSKRNVALDSPSTGLYISNNTWREMHGFSSDCVLMVLASEHYDESDYVRDYSQFLELSK